MLPWVWGEVSGFSGWEEFDDFRVWLIEQTKNGEAFQIPIPDWYQHAETIGIHWYYRPDDRSVWELSDPDPPFPGTFLPVPPEEIIGKLTPPPHLPKDESVVLRSEFCTEEAHSSQPRKAVTTLFQVETDELSSHIWASFSSDGDLLVSGQDIGEFVKERMGTDEYEYGLFNAGTCQPCVLKEPCATK